jgi:hypothetical protein
MRLAFSVKTLAAVIAILVVSACASPTGPSTLTPPNHGSFVGNVYPHGTTTLKLTLTGPGTLALTLTQVDPAATVLGLALGVQETTGRCTQTQHVKTGAGSVPQLTAVAPAGAYCVEVFDLGTIDLSGASFVVNIAAS